MHLAIADFRLIKTERLTATTQVTRTGDVHTAYLILAICTVPGSVTTLPDWYTVTVKTLEHSRTFEIPTVSQMTSISATFHFAIFIHVEDAHFRT
jgi:heme/copper-type cytochrome/quinol oxidase subunit 4